VAEQFTGTAGTYVPIGETVRSFREILDGKHDELPEGAFLLKGSIDDVVSAAGKGEGKSGDEDSGDEDGDDEDTTAESGDDSSDEKDASSEDDKDDSDEEEKDS
jgi:hypothetical protein